MFATGLEHTYKGFDYMINTTSNRIKLFYSICPHLGDRNGGENNKRALFCLLLACSCGVPLSLPQLNPKSVDTLPEGQNCSASDGIRSYYAFC